MKRILSILLIITIILAMNNIANASILTRGVNSYSNSTIEQLRKITKNTRMSGYEQTILDVEKTYQVNAFFILAVAQAETSMGGAGVGKSRNNCFGITNGNGFARYSNVGESIKAFGQLMNKYFNRGNSTLSKIARVYCPPSSSNWALTIEQNINNIYYKMQK